MCSRLRHFDIYLFGEIGECSTDMPLKVGYLTQFGRPLKMKEILENHLILLLHLNFNFKQTFIYNARTLQLLILCDNSNMFQ